MPAIWKVYRCSGCKFPLFLEYAVKEDSNLTDTYGFHRYAVEPWRYSEEYKELAEVFEGEYSL